MKSSQLYRCGVEDVWQRQTGKLRPREFARRIGGCEDLIKRLELYAKLDGHEGCVNTVHFNPSGDLLVSGSDDREIVIWDWAAKAKKLSYSSGHKGNVFQARIMPFSDDRSIISCAEDGQVRHGVILENGSVETKKLARHRDRCHKLAVEPGSPRTFFSCAEDGVVRHFDLRENKSSKLFTCHSFESGKSRRLNVVGLNSIAINPRNPNYFSVGGSDEYARIYDMRKLDADASSGEDQPVDSFTPRHLIGAMKVHITCVAYSQQEELLVSYNDELIYQFEKDMGMGPDPVAWSAEEEKGEKMDIKEGASSQEEAIANGKKIPEVYKGHRNALTVKGVNYFGPNSEYVVSGSDCGRIFIWRKKGGKLVTMMIGDKRVVNCLEPHPFSTVLATSGIDRTVKIWAPTADHLKPLPSDAEKTMERNRRRMDDRLALRPRVIMHVMRLHRPSDRDGEQFAVNRGEYEGDDDEELDFLDSNASDDDSDDEGSHMGPRECIIS